MTWVDAQPNVSVLLLCMYVVPFTLGRKYTMAECAVYTGSSSSAPGHEYGGATKLGDTSTVGAERIQMSRILPGGHEVAPTLFCGQHEPQATSSPKPDDVGFSVPALQVYLLPLR